MIYHFFCFKQLVKNVYYKIFYLFIMFYFMLFAVFYLSNFDMDIQLFNMLLGNTMSSSLLGVLWLLFQILCQVYITYMFFLYEQNSSFEFLMLRKSYKKIVIEKFILVVFLTIFFRIGLFMCTYIFFYKNISFSWESFIRNIAFFVVISFVVVLIKIIIELIKDANCILRE